MAIRKVVGQVTIEERNEIQQLFERRNGLNELAKILTAARNTNGRALKVATGKSTSRHVKSI